MRLLLALFACLSAQSAVAQNATPNHVFQTTETVRLQLAAYHVANFSTASEQTTVEPGILPRHVLQLAGRVMEKVQLLRYMNGLPTTEIPAQPVRDVTPADVNAQIKRIEDQAAELASAYGVAIVATPALPTGKKPADVYANLMRLSQSLDALGVPATVPNDVYRVAQTLRNAVMEVAASAGVAVAQVAPAGAGGRSPADVFAEGLELMRDLQQIATDGSRFAVPGGVQPPQAPSGAIRPADVNKLLLRILADVDAMKFAAGLRTASARPPLEGGKTPADVWKVLHETRNILAAMRAS